MDGIAFAGGGGGRGCQRCGGGGCAGGPGFNAGACGAGARVGTTFTGGDESPLPLERSLQGGDVVALRNSLGTGMGGY